MTDDIEAAQRILTKAGFTEAAGDLGSIPAMRAAHPRTSATVVQGIPLVRVRLESSRDGRRVRRTVTAGMDPLLQLLRFRNVPDLVSEQVRSFLRDESRRLSGLVADAAEAFCKDGRKVDGVRERLREERMERMKRERENLIRSMLGLVASGWTREDLLSAVNETTVLEVLRF